MDRSTFEAELAREGYTVGESSLPPSKPKPEHTHGFDARLFILEGEITITSGTDVKTYRPGDSYALAAGTPHFETVGADGVKYVVGRR